MEKLVQDYVYYLFSSKQINLEMYFAKMEDIRKANGEIEDLEDVRFEYFDQD